MIIDANSKKIANYLRDAFMGTPSVQRYYAADNVRFVDIIKTPHSDGITFLGTIGGFRKQMKAASGAEKNIRVELISAVEEKYVDVMALTLSFLLFCLDTDKTFYHPGLIIEDAIPENGITEMRDIFLCDPFLWEQGLPGLDINENHVAFLYALPITQEEKHYYEQHGAESLDKLLQQQNIPYYDLAR